MAALERPSDAFDGTPSALKRLGRAAAGASLGTDPRTEGAPARTRPRPRPERPADPPRVPPPPPEDRDRTEASPVVDPADAALDLSGPATVLFDQETTATPISGLPATASTVLVPEVEPQIAPEPLVEPDVVDPDPTPTRPLIITPAQVDPVRPLEPEPRRERSVGFRRAPKPRVRRVRRIVRSIDTWTVFKISVLFYLVLYAILLVAGVLLWNLAYATGTIDNLERFFESFGWETFEFQGGELFHSAWIAGLFLVAAGTGLNVVMATVFNLMADLVGGVGVTVLEEEVRIVPDSDLGQRRPRRRRR